VIRALVLFGTRPEVIKLAPVVRALEARPESFRVTAVASGQHKDLLYPFAAHFGLPIHKDLKVMRPGQNPSEVCGRVLAALDGILGKEPFDVLLVQGDTTTAMAGALAAFHRRIPVGHVEAGLRSGDPMSPFPEEMNRRVITRLATFHFAATPHNREVLLREGVEPGRIFVTGNPVVDALQGVLRRSAASPQMQRLLESVKGRRLLVLTTHRRESFGEKLTSNLQALRAFVVAHEPVHLVFPVHPNPIVREAAKEILDGHPRIHLLEALGYDDFVFLLKEAWLIVSDSGGVQEEAPTLGKPLLVLRENTERPEVLDSGVARLVGGRAERLSELLEEAYAPGSWAEGVAGRPNPFGEGDAGDRIAEALVGALPPAANLEKDPDPPPLPALGSVPPAN
jgi:UDP-N-acetylglucosamine 2-epimerase (non-hydrolysing)